MQPSEFRDLSPGEWWAEFDSRMDANDRMQDAVEQAKTGGRAGGGFTSAEWADARRRFKERKAKAT